MMTAVESQAGDALLRPTDLSLKSCLNNKYKKANSQSPNQPPLHLLSDHKMSYVTEPEYQWRHKIKTEPVTMPSPIATYATAGIPSMAGTLPLDSMTKFVVWEKLLSQCHRYSPPTVYDPVSVAHSVHRSRVGSDDSSGEKLPISQPLLDAAKGLTELQHGGIHNERRFVQNLNVPTSNEAPSYTSTSKGKNCKRKGGWKFHDFSDESEAPGKKKRAYCHNRLESEILQAYQDRVTIKEVPVMGNSAKPTDRLVIIEPSQIIDADLIRYNTCLRVVLDKKKGTYRLQVLPHTIEQGPLSNKTQVLHAVSKMLGQTGAVLCPGIARARLPPVDDSDSSWTAGRSHTKASTKKKAMLGFVPTSDSSSEGEMSYHGDKYRGRWKMPSNFSGKSTRSLTPPENATSNSSAVTRTDKLLMTLNKELSESQRQTALARHKTYNSTTDCLLWHVPTPGSKVKKGTWPEEAKWCRNCLLKMRAPSKHTEYPRVSST